MLETSHDAPARYCFSCFRFRCPGSIPIPTHQRNINHPRDNAAATIDGASSKLTFTALPRLCPATTNAPNRVDLQLAGGMVSVEFLPNNQTCTVVAPKPLANDIASLIQSVAKSDGLGLRVLPLNDNGQASLAQALPDPFASLANQRTNPNARGGDGFKFSLPSFSGNRLTQLTSVQQDPNAANTSGQVAPTDANPSTSTTPPNTKDNTLPLPQFDGVQIEMLPEIDAIILRGRDQQLSDLTEIIKRLDEASRLVKPEIEVIPLVHANSKSLADLITKQQET